MRRDQLEHLIRAAGAVCASRRVLVIGSQAVLGQYPTGAPARAVLSMEADLCPLDAPARTDLISGSLGDGSPFHEAFGYYGDGVDLDTAKLPEGWQDRLVPIENANTNGFVGLCLELHDLLVAKYFAGREKDYEFAQAVIGAGLVNKDSLLNRVARTELNPERAGALCALIERHFASV
ncbi:MAG: hypothetical protein COS34_04355 [Lysobacterales bacterium CG02_land_8_20_14_3_00_62_12]|nr:MAG: hypothetical protein COS34_04355 [Xanthomonadales bacterium CG02_land_8_20_14_3_00_62_12]